MAAVSGVQVDAADAVSVDGAVVAGLAAVFSGWADTLELYLGRLRVVMGSVPDAAGVQDAGRVFVNGDPGYLVCGVQQGFAQFWGKLAGDVSTLIEALRTTAGEPGSAVEPGSGLAGTAAEYARSDERARAAVAVLDPGGGGSG